MSQVVETRIHALGDPEPLFPELVGKVSANGAVVKMAVLESGMESGKTSVALYVETDGGDLICCQMSSGMLINLAAIVQGAIQRFGK